MMKRERGVKRGKRKEREKKKRERKKGKKRTAIILYCFVIRPNGGYEVAAIRPQKWRIILFLNSHGVKPSHP